MTPEDYFNRLIRKYKYIERTKNAVGNYLSKKYYDEPTLLPSLLERLLAEGSRRLLLMAFLKRTVRKFGAKCRIKAILTAIHFTSNLTIAAEANSFRGITLEVKEKHEKRN